MEVAMTVGEEGVIAIFAGQPFYIFEVAGNRRSVPVECLSRVVLDGLVGARIALR